MHNKSTFGSVILPISSGGNTRRTSQPLIQTQPSFFPSKLPGPASSFQFPHKFSILIAFVFNLSQWLIINLIEKQALEIQPKLSPLHQNLSLGCMLTCYLIIFAAFCGLKRISPFNCFLSFAAANLCLAVATFANQYSIVHRALLSNSVSAYYSLLFSYLLIIPNTLIADMLFSPFYLKIVPPSGNVLALILAFSDTTISRIGFYWVHIWLCFFSIIIISAGKSLLASTKIDKASDRAKVWGPAHEQALQTIPSLVAIVSKENKLVYSNEEFNKCAAKYTPNLLEKIVAIRSRAPEREKQEVLASNRNSVIRFDQTESHVVLSKHFEEDHFDQSIHENMRSQTLCYYSNLLEVVKILNEAQNKVSFVSTRANSVFHFEGKIFNHEYGLPPTMLEIKVSKVPQSKEILLIINVNQSSEFNTPRDSGDEYKENLLATVSHEMRAPLNGNLTLIEAAMSREDLPADLRDRYLTPAYRSGKLLLHLVNDILDTAQIKAKKLRINPTRQSLRETVQHCCQLLDMKAKMQCVRLTYEMDPHIPDIFFTDHSRLSQILLNLLSNALKFTFEGEVKVVTKLVGPGFVEFNVTDSGIGMSQEDVSQLFRQFTRISYGKRKNINTTGVGLGLTIANKLVKALGPVRSRGIKVESQPEQGSTFSFIVQEGKTGAEEDEPDLTVQDSERPFNLRENDSCKASLGLRRLNFNNDGSYSPSSAAGDERTQFEGFEENNDANKPYESPSPKKLKKIVNTEKVREIQNGENIFKTLIKSSYNLMKKKSQEQQQMTVLVVDDEPFNILAIETLINKLGIKMESACNGKEAIEKIMKNSKEPSSGTYKVIFMDCQMPIMDGYEATEVLQSMFKGGEVKEIPIIGCSGYQNPEHIEKCKDCGMIEVISKPIDKKDLEEIIQKYTKELSSQSPQ